MLAMAKEPVEVEVLDRDGTPALPPETGGLPAWHPLRPLLYMLGIVFAMGILLMAIGQMFQERALRAQRGEDEE